MIRVATLELVAESLERRKARREAISIAVDRLLFRVRLLELSFIASADIALRLADVMLEADEQFIIDEAAKRAAKDGQGK